MHAFLIHVDAQTSEELFKSEMATWRALVGMELPLGTCYMILQTALRDVRNMLHDTADISK